MDSQDFFNFEFDTQVPDNAISIGHSSASKVFTIDEVVTIAGKPASGDKLSAGEIRKFAMSRWPDVKVDTPIMVRTEQGQVKINEEELIEPGSEIEFRAEDGEKGIGYDALRSFARKLGLGGNGKKEELIAKIARKILPELEGKSLPIDESKSATVIVLQSEYHEVRYEKESAHKKSLSQLIAKYGEDAKIERGKVVCYVAELSGKTSFVSRTTSTRYIGMHLAQVVNEVAGDSKPLHIQSDPEDAELLEAGSTLTIVLA